MDFYNNEIIKYEKIKKRNDKEKSFIYRLFQLVDVLSCTNENKQKVHKNWPNVRKK